MVTPAQTPTHNPTTDEIRRAYLAHIAGRPQINPHELHCSQKISEACVGWLREVYRNLGGRPDLQQFAKRAGEQINELLQRLEHEAQQGRAH